MTNSDHPRLIVTAGDPAGIGPDICLDIADTEYAAAIAVVGDPAVFAQRAQQLKRNVELRIIDTGDRPAPHRRGSLQVIAVTAATEVVVGKPDFLNAPMVLRSLDIAASACLSGRYDAMVTAPVSKAILSQGNLQFSGHTEYLAAADDDAQAVMLLCAGALRVALATTHLPLSEVPRAITAERLQRVIRTLDNDLKLKFGIVTPTILVCGLNPHAGESGKLGREELEIIGPAVKAMKAQGLDLLGPLPADTAFVPRQLQQADAVLAMYHDQGLPVLKYAGFGNAVNVTLGLSFIRTSVDHGTAFDIAGSGRADPSSLNAAIELALELVRRKNA